MSGGGAAAVGKGGGASLGDINVSNGESGTAGEAPATCGGTSLAASPRPVNVLLLVDKSSSMSSTPVGFGDSKWNGLRAALNAALDATQGKVAFGLDFFPSSGDPALPLANVCALPTNTDPAIGVAANASTFSAIKQELTVNTPAGATPTAAALGRALNYFTRGAGAQLVGEHYVLLATDGGPNCDDSLSCQASSCTVNMDGSCPPNTNCCDPKLDPAGPGKCLDDAGTTSVVKELALAGVKTIVVGIPGTEAYGGTLDAIAVAGGVQNPNSPPNYFAVSAAGGVKALSQVLTNITTGLITSCSLVLQEDPPDYQKINVVIDGETIPEGSPNGWALDTTNTPPTIALEGTTCETVRTSGAQKLSITFGCPTEHVK